MHPNPESESEGLEYHGEVRARHWSAAIGLNLLLPGLGYVYCGRPMLGAVLCVATLGTSTALLTGGWIAGVFMLKPLGLSALILVYAQAGMAIDLRRLCRTRGAGYVLQPFNHPAVYVAAVTLLLMLPMGVGLSLATQELAGGVVVGDHAMFPRLVPGDRVYFDRTVYSRRSPVRGELVIARLAGETAPRILRVVGVPGDELAVSGMHVLIDGQPMTKVTFAQVRLEETLSAAYGGGRLAAATEFSPDTDLHYAVFHLEEGGKTDRYGPITLADGEFFLLGDCRDALGTIDSRTAGPVELSAILGAPRYVFWSRHPLLGVLWDRIGVSLRAFDAPASGN